MNIKKYRKTIIGIITALSCMAVLACELDVPVKEMSLAKFAITRAIEVKAEKYAPQELKKAQESLYKTHELVKAEDVKKAKQEAENSLKAANDAINKSLPLLAKDQLEEAKKAFTELDSLNAEKYAKEEYESAKQALKEAEDLNTAGDYWESYKKSLEAGSSALNAKNKALAGIPSLEQEIQRIETESTELKNNRGQDFAAAELQETEKLIVEAKQFLANKNLKETATKVAAASESLKAAKEKTSEGIAKEKLASATEMLTKVKSTEHNEFFKEDIDTAASEIEEGKLLLENREFKESAGKSKSAMEKLNAISIALEQKAEEIRLQKEKEKMAMMKKEKAEKETATNEMSGEYVVKLNPKKRDCLWRIAGVVYKDARMWPLIYMANRDKIKDPDLIFPGQKLEIPPLPKKGEAVKDIEKKEEGTVTEKKEKADQDLEKEETEKKTQI